MAKYERFVLMAYLLGISNIPVATAAKLYCLRLQGNYGRGLKDIWHQSVNSIFFGYGNMESINSLHHKKIREFFNLGPVVEEGHIFLTITANNIRIDHELVSRFKSLMTVNFQASSTKSVLGARPPLLGQLPQPYISFVLRQLFAVEQNLSLSGLNKINNS